MHLPFLIFWLLYNISYQQTTETADLCDENCIKCTSTPPYLCLTCALNYNKQHNRCYKITTDCISPCLQCAGESDSMRCVDCPTGYWINEQWKCEQCWSGCEECSGSGVSDCTVCTGVNQTVNVNDEERCCPLKYYMNYNYQCEPCGQHCLSCYHQIQGCIACEDDYILEIENECYKNETDKDWKTIMWVGIALGIVIFLSTIIGIWWMYRKPTTEFAKVGKTTYEVMLQSSLKKTTRKDVAHVCGKCSGMCVRCNKKAGSALAHVCTKCQVLGKCTICHEIESWVNEKNTPGAEVAIEHENDNEKKEFDLGRLCDGCAKIGFQCYNCGQSLK